MAEWICLNQPKRKKKRILVKSIDTSISYQVIGIDLAKHLVSACLITGAGEIFGIDRLTYDDLLKVCRKNVSDAFFAWSRARKCIIWQRNYKVTVIILKVIDGAAVKEYIKTQFRRPKD